MSKRKRVEDGSTKTSKKANTKNTAMPQETTIEKNLKEYHDEPLFYDREIKQFGLAVNSCGLPWTHITTEEKQNYEPIVAGGLHAMIPISLLQNPDLFQDVFSVETWTKVLSPEERNFLIQFLPTGIKGGNEAKERLISDLFSRKNFFFGNDVDTFISHLQRGEYHPFVQKQLEHNRQLQVLNCQLQTKLRQNDLIANMRKRRQEAQQAQKQQTEEQAQQSAATEAAPDSITVNVKVEDEAMIETSVPQHQTQPVAPIVQQPQPMEEESSEEEEDSEEEPESSDDEDGSEEDQ